MTRVAAALAATVVAEEPVAGEVPRYEIPGWRERLGLVAGVTARGPEPGRGFDLGLWTDAPVGEVMTRWRLLRRMEPGFRAAVLGHQVHGSEVVWHQGGAGWTQLEGVDGHATAEPGMLLTVTVADCIPVYLADPVRRIIALLHSGWRGTAGGILAAGIQLMVDRGAAVGDIVMHCGVGICGACYEVGREVMEGCGLAAPGAGPWHADLRAVLTRQATSLGIRAISTSHWCSMHDYPAFFSHRASGGRDGRMVAFLGMLP